MVKINFKKMKLFDITSQDAKYWIQSGTIEEESSMNGPTNVEITYGPFIGRQIEMHLILKHLHTEKRMIVITGQYGIGKTRFVTELARYMVIHNTYKDGVFYIDFLKALNATDVSNLLSKVGFEKLFNAEEEFDDTKSTATRKTRRNTKSK